VRLPDGKQATREYVQHPGAVMVIPLFDDGRVLMESQFRYPIGKVMAEFPAGKLDPNEGALACAVRELREETGYTAREYVFLTRIHPIISYSTEFIDLYLARAHGRRAQARRRRIPRNLHGDAARPARMGAHRPDLRREDDHRHDVAREGAVRQLAARRAAEP
jgi:8-oxo-dGTP pyrophosphatase MutT (NUDIX family)